MKYEGMPNIKMLSYLGARGVLGQAVLDFADELEYYAITADVGAASGFSRFQENYRERYLNVGIAEQDMIAVAAGLASEEEPVIATSWAAFASFRCADQIRCFLSQMHSNVKIVGLGSGLANSRSGSSHFGINELAMLRSLPGIDIICPCDGLEIYMAIKTILENDHPTYVWLTGGERLPIINQFESYDFQIGKANVLRNGEDVLMVSCGNIVSECLKAADILDDYGVSTEVLNMHTIKPLDVDSLTSESQFRLIVTVEEHCIMGGLGSAVEESLSMIENRPKHIFVGINDIVLKAGDYNYLLECCGLTAEQIASRVLKEI